MSRMADQFVDALVRHVDGPNPGKTEQERMRERRQRVADAGEEVSSTDGDGAQATDTADADESDDPAAGEATDGPFGDDAGEAFAAAMDAAVTETDGEDEDDGTEADAGGSSGGFSASEVLERLSAVENGPSPGTRATTDGGAATEPESSGHGADELVEARDELGGPVEDDDEDGIIDGDNSAPPEFRNGITGDGGASEYDIIDGEDEDPFGDDEPLAVRELKADIAGMETKTRKMLAFYREFGPGTPLNAHFAAGGDGDRTQAYARNRTLRTRGLIEHVGRGRYDYCLRDLLADEFDGHVDEGKIADFADNIESRALDGADVEDADAE